MFNMLEYFEFVELYECDFVFMIYIVVEVMKFVFVDCVYWLGDVDFVKVLCGLICEEYVVELVE